MKKTMDFIMAFIIYAQYMLLGSIFGATQPLFSVSTLLSPRLSVTQHSTFNYLVRGCSLVFDMLPAHYSYWLLHSSSRYRCLFGQLFLIWEIIYLSIHWAFTIYDYLLSCDCTVRTHLRIALMSVHGYLDQWKHMLIPVVNAVGSECDHID